MAFFEGLVYTEDGRPVDTVYVGQHPHYVIDDQGFRRHIDGRAVDRAVLALFTEMLEAHRDEAAVAMLKLMGQDDLFSKAAVDSTLRNLNLEQIIDHGLPADARNLLGMMGFRIIIDMHGEVVDVQMPQGGAGDDGE